jgi:hypothetical protein
MAEQIAIEQQMETVAVANVSLPKIVDDFSKTATYAAPEIISFPLNGLRLHEATSLTGNT